ncbi:MAG TPA: ATP-dependent sacrificial sulfur transferase LarE, partial [Terrimicrobiaceae bacterium]|nr:ATP-dependent sacrificial sulfur transferase LarE [Terrimicrobiaceae bacterium]
EKLAHLESLLRAHAPLLVAYSGGVDSTCLLAVAHRTLGDRVLGVIADSPSLPRKALGSALEVARAMGVRVEVIATREFENDAYLSNPPNRCYFCKAELFARMNVLAAERGFAAIVYGENADDPAHLRPGSRAAAEFAVLAPLKQAGLTKGDVRRLSREFGLPTADEPAQPCLSSRIPHGTPVTQEALALVERGEEAVRSLGFRVFRVRYLAPAGARVQVAPDEMPALAGVRERLFDILKHAGFGFVEIDPRGYGAPPV